MALAVLLEWHQTRRLNAAVAGICCERCGKFLGKAALAAADAADRARLAALQRRYRTSLVNVVRRADACCTRCGRAYACNARSAVLLAMKGGD